MGHVGERLVPEVGEGDGLPGVTEQHRNLIHPRAEIRGAAPIDGSTLKTMQGVLEEVLRDLRQAHENGVLDDYAQGHVV